MANVKLVYINGTGGYVQSSSTADEASGLGKITLAGLSGVALDAGGAALTNLALTPTNASDAASKSYVDARVSGLTWLAPVVVVATSNVTLSGSQTIDSVTPANGARVLITGQNGSTPDAANGIYIVNTAGAWSRSADVLVDGDAMFTQQGTTYANTQWVLTTNGTIVPNVTPIIFQQVGAAVTYTAGDGINIVGTTISAKGDSAAAINVDATNGIQVKADTNFGLSIDATTGLRVDLASDPGLEFNSGNLRIKVASADELSLDGNGLNVEGVPTQFKIGASATSANVTATNINALTDSSSVTNLHRHDKVVFASTASLSLGQGYPVYADAANTVLNGDAAIANNKAGIVGVALDNYTGGDPAFIQSHGRCAVFTGLTAGTAYYLPDSPGTPVAYSAITSGNRAIRIGYALNSTTIQLQIQDMGVKP
jgi:hypothetical protein